MVMAMDKVGVDGAILPGSIACSRTSGALSPRCSMPWGSTVAFGARIGRTRLLSSKQGFDAFLETDRLSDTDGRC